MTDADRRTVQNGNGTLRSCLSILEACRAMNIPAALGNPASSLMWHAPELQMQGAGALALAEWRVDFCQCGTSWMKPTRLWMLQCVGSAIPQAGYANAEKPGLVASLYMHVAEVASLI